MYFKIDKDNQGYVTMENTREFFGNYFEDEMVLKSFFDAMDLDGNGKVHWNEFLSSMIT